MTRIIRLFAIGIVSVFLFGIASPQDVLACSGGRSSSINELVSYADVIVRGRIIETDNSYQNGVMQVSEYIKGAGDELILISIIDSVFILNRILRPSSGGCFYGIPPFPQDKDIVIFLYNKFDGSYGLSKGHYSNQDYYIADEEIYIGEDRFGVRVWRGIDYDKFVDVVENITGENASQPTRNQYPPLHAPLLITTEFGTKYIVPIEGSSLVLLESLVETRQIYESSITWFGKKPTQCWQVGCLGQANSHLDTGVVTSDIVRISYMASHIGNSVQNGKGFSFSPTYDGIVAIWATNITNTSVTIGIYRYQHPYEGFPMRRGVVLNTDTFYPHSGAWSPRGRYLAYADTDGIYLWDVFTQNSSPELLIETNHKMIHGFSPMGRFLMVGNEENGFSYRLQDGSTHPIGAFSPNDRILLPYQNPSQIIYFLPNYEVATIELPNELVGYHTEKIVWANNNRFYRLLCNMESCFMAGGDISHRVYTAHPLIEARNFDYDELNDQLVILRDDWNITITTPFTTLEYDLSDALDSPIASIEWLPSLFYYDD